MICPLCQSSTLITFIHTKLHKPYHRCKQCDFIWLDPEAYVSFEKEQSQYKQHNNTIENSGYVAMFERFLTFIQLEDLEVKKTLDFGSGPGPVLAEILTRKGYQVSHYDPIFANDTSLLKVTYDLITMTEVIEHLHHPFDTLKKLYELIKPGGYLAIMTQFHPETQEDFLRWWYPRDPTHVGFYTPKSFEILAPKLGFELCRIDQKSQVLLRRL